MGITFKDFAQCVPIVTFIKKPVLLRSRHGVGKSSVVYAYAEHIGLPVIERRASQMTEGDLLGLPKLKNNKTEWIPPAWLKDACDNPVVLFIDEIDRATPEVRQGFFELTDSRKIAGWELHNDTLVFAAINGGAEYADQYQVGEMDPAELDRWTVFDIEPSTEDWLIWARKDDNIHPIICDFISQSPQHLEHIEDFEPNKVYPSRRSWHRFSDACKAREDLIEPGNASPLLFMICQAFLGLESAVSFQDYVRTYSIQVSPEDIIVKGRINLTEKFDINDHSSLIEKIADYLKKNEKKIDKERISNLGDYFVTLPSECAMTLWEKVGSISPMFVRDLHVCNDGQVSKYLIKVLTSNPKIADKTEDDE